MTLDAPALKGRRRELGLSQSDAAELATISVRTVAAAESGTPVSHYSARQLSTALGVPYVALIRPTPRTIRRLLVERGYAPAAPPAPSASRARESERLVAALRDNQSQVVGCIAGPSGIGKTVLAQHLVAELAPVFPDGIVWMTMPARDPSRLTVMQLELAEVFGFANRLPQRDAANPGAFDGAFRRQLFERRRLMVLDDVAGPKQIDRFVQPGGVGWILVTTAHRQVADQVGGPVVELGPLAGQAALDLLAAHIGAERLREDPEAANRLVQILAGVPRSLQIAGRVLSRERFTRLVDYAERLVQAPGEGDLGVRPLPWSNPNDPDASFSTAYLQLRRRFTPESWRTFGALSVFEGRIFPMRWAVAVMGTPPAVSRTLLAELHDLYVIREADGAERSSATTTAQRERWFHVDAQAQRVAEWIAAEGLSEAQSRLYEFAEAEAEAMRLGDAPPSECLAEVTPNLDVWRLCLDRLSERVLAAYPQEMYPLPEDLPRLQLIDTGTIARLPPILRGLRAMLMAKLPSDAGRWLAAGLTVANATDDTDALAELAICLGLWLAVVQRDFESAGHWSRAASAWFRAQQRPDDACEAMMLVSASMHALAVFQGSEAHRTAIPDTALDAVAFAREAPVAPLRRACILCNAAVQVGLTEGHEDAWIRATELLEEGLMSCSDLGEAMDAVRAHCVVNLAIVRRALGQEPSRSELVEALATLEALVAEDDFSTYLLAAIGRLLAGQTVGIEDGQQRRRVQQQVLLSVPPHLLSRRLLNLSEMAMPELARRTITEGRSALGAGVATPVGRLAATDFLVNLPIAAQIGVLPLLYPIEPLVELLDDEGLPLALCFADYVCAPDHPTYRMLHALAAARAGRLAPP